MKSTTIISIIILTFTFVNINSAAEYINITPFANESDPSQVYGNGFSIPLEVCLAVNGQYIQFHNYNNDNVTLQFFDDNCTEVQYHRNYQVNTIVPFNIMHDDIPYNAVLSTDKDGKPSDAIEYITYYYSNFCSGPTYSIYYTNGYTTDNAKYICEGKDEPEVFVCNSPNNCQPLDFHYSCNIGDTMYPFKVRC